MSSKVLFLLSDTSFHCGIPGVKMLSTIVHGMVVELPWSAQDEVSSSVDYICSNSCRVVWTNREINLTPLVDH
jgi:hypothetical protein